MKHSMMQLVASATSHFTWTAVGTMAFRKAVKNRAYVA